MARNEKTVFISYRRKDLYRALAVYQYLTQHSYDVFFDYKSISSGDFEQIIIGNIKARAHFLLILTPTALDRCNEPGDWLRREIETAISEKRNIIPLLFDGFSFGAPNVSEMLSGKLGTINRYNALDVPAAYFDEAMERLRNRYLNVTLDAVLHPVSDEVQKVIDEQKIAANEAIARQKAARERARREAAEKVGKEQEARERKLAEEKALRDEGEKTRLEKKEKVSQSWEILDTIPPGKLQTPRPSIGKWVALVVSGLGGIILICIISIIVMNWQDALSLIGFSTPTPTIPSVSPQQSPTNIGPLSTPLMTPITPSPTTIEQTAPEAQVTGTIDCTFVNSQVRIRDNPSDVNTETLKLLVCDDNVTLTGRYIPEDSEREWYRISFSQGENLISGWIIASRVIILEGDKERLQVLSYEGIPITTTPSPGQATNLVDCIYTVRAGDSFSSIAQKFGIGDLNSIVCKADSHQCNLSDPNTLEVGWQLIIPGVTADTCASQGVLIE